MGLQVRITPRGMVISLSLTSIPGSQVDVSESGRSLVQRSSNKCGVSECDRESSTMKRFLSNRICCVMGGKKFEQSDMR